ncbi:Uncharacterised protein [Vibrio cholerae]|nr:Uncharacterised protein [Vibrio cholerae]CSI96706.1 Uncharacterised protein [Vibrio cholerae]
MLIVHNLHRTATQNIRGANYEWETDFTRLLNRLLDSGYGCVVWLFEA